MTAAVHGDPYTPDALEVASGLILGVGSPEPLPAPSDTTLPTAALERAILPALLRPPSLVCFTGDAASSALLAVAVHLARREGLEQPVPATIYPLGLRSPAERHAQERVIVQLGLTDWLRFEFGMELDLVGPTARSVMSRHGLFAPVDLHCYMPLVVEASGGSLIAALAKNDVRPPRTAIERLSWLCPAARQEVLARHARERGSEPSAPKDRPAWARRLRRVRMAIDSLARIAAPLRVHVVNPLFDAHYAAAAASGGHLLAYRFQRKLSTVAEPRMDRTLWGDHSRGLAEAWDGDGVDEDLVNVERLREEWSTASPDRHSYLLLRSLALRAEEESTAYQVAKAPASLA